MRKVTRTMEIPEYIFSKIDEKKRELKKRGIKVIDLGIGDPDIPTPDFIINSFKQSLNNSKIMGYPPYNGIREYRQAVCSYYEKRFGIHLNPDTQVAALIGSKEGIAHAILGLTDPGDRILIPNPGYPVYRAAAAVAGCSCGFMKLDEENGFLPDTHEIEKQEAIRLTIVNYPNNPTGAVANKEFYSTLIEIAEKKDMIIINDGAYMDITTDGQQTCSLLAAEKGTVYGLEFGSMSKSFNMTGWRIGFVAGCSEAIEALMRIKTNFDSGQFIPIQMAAADALNHKNGFTDEMNSLYNYRRVLAEKALKGMGIRVYKSKGAFYVWFHVPNGYSSASFAEYILEKAGIIITPGSAFGSCGEGYCRISLTVPTLQLLDALNRISSLNFCP